MSFIVSCPYCAAKARLTGFAVGASVCCPKCGSHFTAVPGEGAAALHLPEETAAIEEAAPASAAAAAPKGQAPAWINSWGACAFCLGSVALLNANVTHLWLLTVSVAAVALLFSLKGVVALSEPKRKDVVWLTLGGGVAGIVLLLAVFRPGVLNPEWGMPAVPATQLPQRTLRVAHDGLVIHGEWAAGDMVDAREQAIRQHGVLIRVDEAAFVRSAGKTAIAITIAIDNARGTEEIVYEGFDKHPPTLRDDQGRPWPLLEAGTALRKFGQIALAQGRKLRATLVFQAPAGPVQHLDLELPAAAWGKTGVFTFRIPRDMVVLRVGA